MNAVRLHELRILIHVHEQERDKRNFMFFRQLREHGCERLDVIGAVIGGQGDAKQNKRNFCFLDARNHFVQVFASGFYGNAAQTVVAAKFQYDQGRMRRNDIINASQPVRGGITAHALVIDPILVPVLLQQVLQVVRIRSSRYTRRKTVAKSDDSWAFQWSCNRVYGTGRYFRTLFLSRGCGFLSTISRQQDRYRTKYRCENKTRPLSLHIFKIDMHSSTVSPDTIQVSHLFKTINNGSNTVEILRDISFSVPAGQFVAIMGASGSGKSTLLGLLAGLDTVTSGSIVLDGTDISRMREDELARLRGKKIGFVFQSYQLVPTLTAEENVLLPAELTGADRGVRQRAKDLLERVGLLGRAHHYPVQLSGGEQQRVALARAFITRPPILMADEPTGNLDSANGQHVLDLLLQLNREERTTLVLVTHDRHLAEYADRVITLSDGQVLHDELVGQEARA